MKANKALKRLAKIEASMSNVAARYSATEPHTQEVLQDAKAAVARAREAVQASSRAVKNPAKPKRKLRAAAGQAGRAAKKSAPVRKKAAVKKVAVKPLAAKTTKKRAPIKTAVKKTAAKPTTPAQYPMPAPGM
jgi:hypothetical protein